MSPEREAESNEHVQTVTQKAISFMIMIRDCELRVALSFLSPLLLTLHTALPTG
jgi:hypothetical protein